MGDCFAKTILKYRRKREYTQEELANKLGVTFQAVSRWENGLSRPDIDLIPKIAKIFDISIDKLFGYPAKEKKITIYDDIYKLGDYYWGILPSKMSLKILEILPPNKKLKILDVGCGEGKDAVFFARNGYSVTAFDISDAGLKKTEELAKKANVNISIFKADILDFRLSESYDIIFSTNTFQYLIPEQRDVVLNNYKNFTNEGGLNVLDVIVEKPFIGAAPEKEPQVKNWRTGQLFRYYEDWYIESLSEYIYECGSSGVPHKHAVNEIIARKHIRDI